MDNSSKPLSRRSFLKGITLGIAGATLAACAPGAITTQTSSTNPTPAANKPGPAKVRYAHMNCWDDTMCKGQRDLVKEFNDSHPNIVVEPVEWSWGNYLATLTASVSAGEAPDIMNVGWGEVVSLGRPYFEPLDSYINDDLKQNINPASWTSSKLNDKTYGIPVFEQLNEVEYFRQDVWDNAGITKEPETWEDYVQVLKTLKDSGISDPWGMQANGAPIVSRFLEIQFQNGSDVFKNDGDKWTHTFNTPEAKEAAKFWYDLWNDFGVIPKGNLQRSTSDLEPLFKEGKVGLLSNITQSYFSMVSTYPDIADQIRVAPVMRNKVGATLGGAFGMSMFLQSKAKQAAWEFIAWATSKDVMQKYWVPTAKVLPTRKDVPLPKMHEQVTTRMAEYQKAQRVFPFFPDWEAVKGKVLTPVLGEMAGGKVDFETGYQNIIKQIEFLTA